MNRILTQPNYYNYARFIPNHCAPLRCFFVLLALYLGSAAVEQHERNGADAGKEQTRHTAFLGKCLGKLKTLEMLHRLLLNFRDVRLLYYEEGASGHPFCTVVQEAGVFFVCADCRFSAACVCANARQELPRDLKFAPCLAFFRPCFFR